MESMKFFSFFLNWILLSRKQLSEIPFDIGKIGIDEDSENCWL